MARHKTVTSFKHASVRSIIQIHGLWALADVGLQTPPPIRALRLIRPITECDLSCCRKVQKPALQNGDTKQTMLPKKNSNMSVH